MRKCFIIEKHVSETPLQTLERFRTSHLSYVNEKMTYAGRLDPMASGALLVLCGDERFHKDAYLSLDKQYEFDIVFGIETDSGDILGLPTLRGEAMIDHLQIQKVIAFLPRELRLPVPRYSAKRIDSKPLFRHSRHEQMIDTPSHTVQIHSIQIIALRTSDTTSIARHSIEKIDAFCPRTDTKYEERDFRKSDILKSWQALSDIPPKNHTVLTIRCNVSSGSYVRSIAVHIGTLLNTTCHVSRLHRTKIGHIIRIIGPVIFWLSPGMFRQYKSILGKF